MDIFVSETQVITDFENLLSKQQQERGVCISYFKHLKDGRGWLNEGERQYTFPHIRRSIKKGEFFLVRKYHKQEYIYKGRNFYPLVIQEKGDEDFCPLLMFAFEAYLQGLVFLFTNKENRDNMFNWLKKATAPAPQKVKEQIPDPPVVKKQRRKRKRCEADDPPQQLVASPPYYENGVIDYPTNDPPADEE